MRARIAEPEDRANREPLPSAPPPVTDRVLELQRTVGNRAVGRLMRAPRTAKKPPKAGNAVRFKVVPTRVMTGREFAIFSLAQLYGIGLDAAEAHLVELEERGGGTRSGHLVSGIGRDDVGKTLEVQVELPHAKPDEVEAVRERAEELAQLPEDERKRIDAEADRRFWTKRGDKRQKKLGAGADEAGERELWMRTRDEVMRDRGLLQDLPEQARDFLMPDGRDLDPTQYAAALRIATKVSTFTEAEWALYQRRAGMTTDDYELIEESVDKFKRAVAKDQSIIDRLRGTEELFDVTLIMPSDPYVVEYLQKRKQELLPARFHDIDDYEAACDAYLELFRARAKEITLMTLAASETVVRSELARYTDAGELTKLHDEMAKLRELFASYRDLTEHDTGPAEQSGWEIRQAAQAVEDEEAALAATHPILKDKEVWSDDVAGMTVAELGKHLRSDAEDRIHDIEKTRRRVINDPDAIFQLDRIIATTKEELGAKPGTIGAKIVDHHLQDIKWDHIFKAIATAVLAIGLGLLTFGGGTVAVLAGGAVLAISVYTGVQEIERYGDALAAAHTAFDSDQTLSSDSPSAVWAALSLIAIGIDAGALVSSLKAAGPALRVLEDTDDVAKFATKLNLAKDEGVLTKFVKARLVTRAKAARKEWDVALKRLGKSMLKAGGRVRSATDPLSLVAMKLWEVLPDLGRAARAAARLGVRRFEEFLARLRLHPALKGIDFDKLSKEDRELFEWVWRENSGQGAAAQARNAPVPEPPTPPVRDTPAPEPPAPAPARPAPTGAPRAPRLSGELHPQDMRTAGTGGIESIERRINTVDNSQTVTITGELKPPMNRATAPNYNEEAMWRTLRDEHGLPDYQGAHLWGPGFGDEAAAGIMLAPNEVNLVWQNGRIEKFFRDDMRHVAETISQRLGKPVTIRIKAVATSHPGTVAGGAALKEVEYTAYAVSEGTEIAFGRVSLEVSAPVTRADGTVQAGRMWRFEARPLDW